MYNVTQPAITYTVYELSDAINIFSAYWWLIPFIMLAFYGAYKLFIEFMPICREG